MPLPHLLGREPALLLTEALRAAISSLQRRCWEGRACPSSGREPRGVLLIEMVMMIGKREVGGSAMAKKDEGNGWESKVE